MGIDGKYIENKGINQIDGVLIKPNYLTTYDFLAKMKKAKHQELEKKAEKKSYLS